MAIQQLLLLVDDNEDNRIVFTAYLQHMGYAVLEAVNGADGVMQASTHHPDLILLDLQMPVMDGWEAAAQLKANDETAEIPVIAISAFDRGDHNWSSAGFSAFLSKPIEPRRLLETIRTYLPPPDVDP